MTETVGQGAGRVSTFNASELSSAAVVGVFKDEGNVFSARGHNVTPEIELLQLHGLQPMGRQVAEVTLVEQGHVGLTVNPIILKDPCH